MTEPDHPPPLTPGAYLKKRREAVGLTLPEAALLLASDVCRPVRFADRTAMERRLTAFESGEDLHGFPPAMISLRRYVHFDRDVLDTLIVHAADPISAPAVLPHCRGCGCSWNDPCRPEPCSWADPAATRCSSCPPLAAAGLVGSADAAGERVPS